jgi:tyrosine-protein phosphatase SIW14
LQKWGVDVVIDLRGGTRAAERDAVAKLSMRYVALPWHCGHPDDESVARFLAILRENQDKKIFVHCHFGTDRTGMMIAAYRIAEQGWSASDARKEMEAYGFSRVHHLACSGLASYEENFPGEFASRPAFEKLRPAEAASDPPPKP